MNEFQENTWTREQIELDARITAEFSSLEAGRMDADTAGTSTKDWQTQTKPQVATITDLLSGLRHARRCDHWKDELSRLGIKVESKPKASDRGTAKEAAAPALVDEGTTKEGAQADA